MAVDDTDEPKFRVDLVFRVKTRTRKLQVADTLVCPAERQRQPVRRDEQGRKIETKKVTCAVCRLCFARQDWLDKANQRLRGQPEQLVSIGKPCVSSST